MKLYDVLYYEINKNITAYRRVSNISKFHTNLQPKFHTNLQFKY